MKVERCIGIGLALALLMLSACSQVSQDAGNPTLDPSFAEYRIFYLSSEPGSGLLSLQYMQDAIGAELATS